MACLQCNLEEETAPGGTKGWPRTIPEAWHDESSLLISPRSVICIISWKNVIAGSSLQLTSTETPPQGFKQLGWVDAFIPKVQDFPEVPYSLVSTCPDYQAILGENPLTGWALSARCSNGLGKNCEHQAARLSHSRFNRQHKGIYWS